MNQKQMEEWIDQASLKDLLTKIRFEPVGSPWFLGPVGGRLFSRYGKLRNSVPAEEWWNISKEIGWK